MSLTVQHLNADSTFLLTFSPEAPSAYPIYPLHTFTIVCDPWLVGDSIVTHPRFAVTKHTVRPYIEDLCDIPEPDVIIVSQNKPDHCHKKTLMQLPPSSNTYIVAEPDAATTIKKWNHFDSFHVLGMPKYNQRKESQIRFALPPLTSQGLPGEVAIAFIPAKKYLTGLHNAIGITYQAPTATKAISLVSTVDLPIKPQDLPHSPAIKNFPIISRPKTSDANVPHISRPRTLESSNEAPTKYAFEQPRPLSPPSSTTSSSRSTIDLPQAANQRPINFSYPLSPPESPLSTATFNSNSTNMNGSIYRTSYNGATNRASHNGATLITRRANDHYTDITPGRPRPISILYTPHGMPYDPDLKPYVTHHLVPAAALPLDLLMHSFDRAQNPWYFGGNISAGSQGGSTIARALMAKAWVSAHDEVKDDQGISVARLKTTRMNAVDVKGELLKGEKGSKGWDCDVRSLGVGEEMILSHSAPGMRNSF